MRWKQKKNTMNKWNKKLVHWKDKYDQQTFSHTNQKKKQGLSD
jgi:hypothetical protein